MSFSTGDQRSALSAPLEDRICALTNAEETVIRERSLALGSMVYNLALLTNGIADESTGREGELRETATHLVHVLGLERLIAIKEDHAQRTASEIVEGRQENVATWAAMVDSELARRQLSLRKAANIVGCSHTQLADLRRGNASWGLTRQAVLALGLVEESEIPKW